MNILFLRAGIFSNLNHHLYEAMCRSHNVVCDVDAGSVLKRKSLQFSAWYNILHTLIHSKRYWKQTHSKNTYAFSKMTQYCNCFIRARTDYDIILQTQCKFSITINPYTRPYFIYTDLTQKLADRIWNKWALNSATEESKNWIRLETEAFQRAEKIFTFNDKIKASFVEDYDISPEKVVVTGSGFNSNSCLNLDITNKYKNEFVVFFLTTEFERQGGPTVIKAYQLIKKTLPDLKLVIGGKCPKNIPNTIQVVNKPTQENIENWFNRSALFLMPGVIGGLQSVLQAMSRKCVPIVGDSNVLLAHVIQNNETGFAVPSNCQEKLAEQIIELYKNKSLAKKIGNQAFNFVNENFTWDKVVQRMSSNF